MHREPTMESALCLVNGMLSRAASCLKDLTDGGELVRQGAAFGDPANDSEIRADRGLGLAMLDSVRDSRLSELVSVVSIEGMDDEKISEGPGHFWITADPLDGSLNYRMRRLGFSLPYTACVTVLTRRKKATFSDILAAGVIDLRSGERLMTYRHHRGEEYFTHHTVPGLPGDRVCLTQRPLERLDLGSQIVIGEFYYPENREKLVRAFAGRKGWLRNPGSAAFEMALVASGTAAAFICDRQKQHELGAGYALVKGAGGVAVDWDGNDLGSRPYDFVTQTPVILAANERLAEELIKLLR